MRYRATVQPTSNPGGSLLVMAPETAELDDLTPVGGCSLQMPTELAKYLSDLVTADRAGHLGLGAVLREQIADGEFENQVPHPGRPKGAQLEHFDEYRKGMQEAEDKFRTAVEEACEMEEHPKRDNFWRMAWERGHSNGLIEVLSEYEELVRVFT